MSYGAEVMQRARQRLADRKADKESRYQENLERAYEAQPRLQEIDNLLRATMVQVAQLALSQGGDPTEMLEKIRQENLALQQERKLLIATHFSPDYLDDSPVCSHCDGNGYIGATMCSCLAALCREEQRKQLGQLFTGTEDFRNVRLDYYSDKVNREWGFSPRSLMEKNLTYCKAYAANFSENAGNLLFFGNTGLGKTFLSACIANVVVDKGYSVVYESAGILFKKLEKNRFNPTEQTQAEADRIANCDLLILDDLGTEMTSTFVTAALYELVNERLLSGKAMIISTNLTRDEIGVRYSHQIASRLVGNFKGVTFAGDDIRLLKNRGVSF